MSEEIKKTVGRWSSMVWGCRPKMSLKTCPLVRLDWGPAAPALWLQALALPGASRSPGEQDGLFLCLPAFAASSK